MKLIPSAFVSCLHALDIFAAWVRFDGAAHVYEAILRLELGRDKHWSFNSYKLGAPACRDASTPGETNHLGILGGMNTGLFYNPNQRPRELGGRATIGVTLSVFRGNDAFDGDILFNGIDHSWTTNAVRNGQVDAVSIITHETGHQLGLNHSPFQNATMYAAYLGGKALRPSPKTILLVCVICIRLVLRQSVSKTTIATAMNVV